MARHPPNRNQERVRPPIDAAGLERLALHYLGRYATTRAKLSAYLARKVGERGWGGEHDAAEVIAGIVNRAAELGYVDDRAFAEMRRSALARRGFGARRQAEALRAAGIAPDDAAAVMAAVGESEAEDEDSVDPAHAAALAFARRKRIGPFAAVAADADVRRRALAAMLRAGHSYDVARRFVEAAPGEVPEV